MSHTSTTAHLSPALHPATKHVFRTGLSTASPPGASPAWDVGVCPPGGGRGAGLTWAVTPARDREKSRGASNRPLNS
eukprot:3086748-Prymnesium_polylepis.1